VVESFNFMMKTFAKLELIYKSYNKHLRLTSETERLVGVRGKSNASLATGNEKTSAKHRMTRRPERKTQRNLQAG